MMKHYCTQILGLVALANILVPINAQIPYSFAGGRDVDAVNRRYDRFQAALQRGASPSELEGICGRPTTAGACVSKVGRPSDSEVASCDVFCCWQGARTGNCARSGGFQVGYSSTGTSGHPTFAPEIYANCRCTNDHYDIKCGLDGSFLGIRCPFDRSACWRKCCRQGREGGKCGGFLKTKCKCS